MSKPPHQALHFRHPRIAHWVRHYAAVGLGLGNVAASAKHLQVAQVIGSATVLHWVDMVNLVAVATTVGTAPICGVQDPPPQSVPAPTLDCQLVATFVQFSSKPRKFARFLCHERPAQPLKSGQTGKSTLTAENANVPALRNAGAAPAPPCRSVE